MENKKSLNSFLKNIEWKEFKNKFEKEFWQKISPHLNEEILLDLNKNLIDEKMAKLFW